MRSIICLVLLAAAALLSYARRESHAAEPGGRSSVKEPLYPLQKELEGKLKGAPKERKQYAALFPLRMIAAASGKDTRQGRDALGKYLYNVAVYIDRERPDEALSLLENLLRTNSRVLDDHPEAPARGWLAKLYINMATRDMKKLEKARFVAGLLAPRRKMAVWEEAEENLVGLGTDGKQAVMEVLRANRTMGLDNEEAITCAAHISYVLHSKTSRLTQNELSEIVALGKKSEFAKLVAARLLLSRGDAKALKFFEELWDNHPRLPGRIDDGIRSSLVLGGLTGVPGGMRLLLKMLRDIDKEKPSKRTESDRGAIFVLIWQTTAWHRDMDIRDEAMERYLAVFAKKAIQLPEKPIDKSSEFVLVMQRAVNRQWARRILDLWKGKGAKKAIEKAAEGTPQR